MRQGQRWGSAALALVLAAGSLMLPTRAAAQPGSTITATSQSAKRLNTRAQELYQRGDLGASADTYAEIFDELPENRVNREERNNTILVTLEVYREAYRRQLETPGDGAQRAGVELLRRAVKVYDRYEHEFVRVYGPGARVSAEAEASGRETKDLLAEAERLLAPEPEAKPEETEPKVPIIRPTTEVPRGPSGTGLIVAGSIMLAAGLGTIAMIIVGAQMKKNAERDRDKIEKGEMVGQSTDEVNRRGRVGSGLIISGAILTGLFLAGGATMLGIGIHRRVRYMAFTPSVGRGYAGLSLRGRF